MKTRRWRRLSPLTASALAFPLLTACTQTAAPARTASPAITTASSATAEAVPPGTWSQARGGATPPLPRDAQAMVYDPATSSVVVFAGKGTRDRYFNDLWAYRVGGGWSRLNPRGVLSPARFGQGMAYDSARSKIVVFGGVLRTTRQPASDTWVYDPDSSTWLRSSVPGASPAARLYPSMVYDQADGKTILFGGWTGASAFNDTWSYDLPTGRWTRVNTAGAPSARWGASMVYDQADDKVILFGGLFGGYDGRSRLGDIWIYDPASRRWTKPRPSGPVPPARAYASMVYDQADGKVILFGGFAGPQGLLADTWAYDPATNQWSMLAVGHAGPSRRDFSSMAYDKAANTIVLFGGQTGSNGNIQATDLNDIWQLRV
jgi:Galactose oxidase, central domain/Kelch motif